MLYILKKNLKIVTKTFIKQVSPDTDSHILKNLFFLKIDQNIAIK